MIGYKGLNTKKHFLTGAKVLVVAKHQVSISQTFVHVP